MIFQRQFILAKNLKVNIDPISYSAYRIKGDFQEAFTFRDYPFDSHTLSIRFRHKRLNSNRLLFVADDIGMQRDGGKAPLDRFIDHSPLDTEENCISLPTPSSCQGLSSWPSIIPALNLGRHHHQRDVRNRGKEKKD